MKGELNIEFQVGDLGHFNPGKKLDAVICMFAVIDYITETEALLETLRNIKRQVNENTWNILTIAKAL